MLGSFRISVLVCLVFCKLFDGSPCPLADGQLVHAQTCMTSM